MALPVRNFGRVTDAVEIPDLVAMQRDGYDKFLQSDIRCRTKGRISASKPFSARFFL